MRVKELGKKIIAGVMLASVCVLGFVSNVQVKAAENVEAVDKSQYINGGHNFTYTLKGDIKDLGSGKQGSDWMTARCGGPRKQHEGKYCFDHDYPIILNPTPESLAKQTVDNYACVEGFDDFLVILDRGTDSKVEFYKVDEKGAVTGGVKCDSVPTEKGEYYAKFVFNKNLVKAFTIDDDWIAKAKTASQSNTNAMSYLSNPIGIASVAGGALVIVVLLFVFINKSKKKPTE